MILTLTSAMNCVETVCLECSLLLFYERKSQLQMTKGIVENSEIIFLLNFPKEHITCAPH